VVSLLVLPGHRHFTFDRNSDFSVGNKQTTKLDYLAENCKLDNLYNSAGYHVVSKAFSISKNAAAVDMLLLNLKCTWSINPIH
jgi:hypothetical protein